jgi:hypothetical protein
MPVEPQAPYISSKDAAKKYGLTHDHIGLLCRRGKLSGLLWGRVWYISEPTLVSYIARSNELKEARKQALSKQWHAAWSAALLLALSLYALAPNQAAADVVSVPSTSFGTQLYLGFEQLGEVVYHLVMPDTHTKVMRVVYAKDFVEEERVAATFEDPFASFLSAAVVQSGAAIEAVEMLELNYAPPESAPILLTNANHRPGRDPAKNGDIFAGIQTVNENLYAFNTAMFATYAWSAQELLSVAVFDAQQAAHVWEKTFAAFGVQFVADMHRLGRAQAQTFSRSISVASTAYTPGSVSFLDGLFTKSTAWVADAGNGVAKLFAKELKTDKLCISDAEGETCLTRAQLNALLAGQATALAEEE